MEGGYFGGDLSYEAISVEITQNDLGKLLHRDRTPFNIICINSASSVTQLLKIASSLTTTRSKISVIYYGLIAPESRVELERLSTHLTLVIVPPLSRDVCALTQQLCSAIMHRYTNVTDFKNFSRHLWTVYSDPNLRHQYFSQRTLLCPTTPTPARHRWIPYVENGHYLLICHSNRLAYLKATGSQTKRVFERETVEVWGRDVVTSLDALDIPYGSRWFIYESQGSCYLDPTEMGRVTALLVAANCIRITIPVE